MKLRKWEMALICALFVSFTYAATADQTRENISNKLIRLHVVANSDSQGDQELKLNVRDRIIEYTQDLLKYSESIDETRYLLESNVNIINAIARDEIQSHNYDYIVSTSIEDDKFFPTKEYDGFALPSGEYTGLSIRIGESAGENWWCVVFPPLCTSLAQEEIEQNLSQQESELVDLDGGVTFKFKLAEVLGEIRNIFIK